MEGDIVVRPVETGCRGEDELLDAVAAAEIEQVERAVGVGLKIDPGVLDGWTDAGTSGEIDYRGEGIVPPLFEELFQRVAVADVE